MLLRSADVESLKKFTRSIFLFTLIFYADEDLNNIYVSMFFLEINKRQLQSKCGILSFSFAQLSFFFFFLLVSLFRNYAVRGI